MGFMKPKTFLKDKGQTSIEYLLVVVVSLGLCMTFFKKFEGYLDTHTTLHLKLYKALFDPELNYKKFRLPR